MANKQNDEDVIRKRSTKRLFADFRKYTDNGSLEASTFLSECYRDGTLDAQNGDDLYKYFCLRCIQGDYEECWRMHLVGKEVSNGFISDFTKKDSFPPDRVTRISETKYIFHN